MSLPGVRKNLNTGTTATNTNTIAWPIPATHPYYQPVISEKKEPAVEKPDDEAVRVAIEFLVKVAQMIDKVDKEIADLYDMGWDSSLIDRMARDKKAEVLDGIDLLIDSLI